MKICKLTIKNVASIESAELDFEHGALGDAPLFLICGETGSGKTTILDAISLALYGKTPRYADESRDYSCIIGGYAFNDMRQLVRRGAKSAEAKVELIGNDGRPYLATWSVTPGKQARTADRLTEHWDWKDCSPGRERVARLETEKEEMSLAAIGLDFEQFCRTTMLAQGQFSKFLLGTPDEKANILEELTDTSKYSDLGIAIADRCSKIVKELGDVRKDIERLAGLGDQRAEIEGRITELSGVIAELNGKIKSGADRLQWLRRRQELSDNRENSRGELAAAYASLKALERQTLVGVDKAKAELQKLKDFLAENSDKAAMYENTNVILSNLADVKQARNRKATAESELARHEKSKPELEAKLAEARRVHEEAAKKVSASEAEVEVAERELENLDVRSVRKRRSVQEKRRGDIRGMIGSMDSVETLERNASEREEIVAGKRAELASLEAELPKAKSAMDVAEGKWTEAGNLREAQKKLIEDGIEKIAAELKVGATCPICGNRIERLNGSEHFRELFRTLDEACSAAEAEFRVLEKGYNSAGSRIAELGKSIESEQRLAGAARDKVRSMRIEISEGAGALGIVEISREGFLSAIGECESAIGDLDVRIADIERKEADVKLLKKSLKKLVDEREAAKCDVLNLERALLLLQQKIETCKTSIASEGDRAADKLRAVNEQISDAEFIARWEGDAEAVEHEISASAAEYLSNREQCPRAESGLEKLESSVKQIADCLARAIARKPDLASIGPAGEPATSTAVVDGLLGRLEECERSLSQLLANPPDELAESDTVESLGKLVGELNGRKDQAVGERGRCNQQLAEDDRCANERKQMQVRVEALDAELKEWGPVNEWFGDKEGKKLRREIQTYVLANVLVKANYYLRQLSDRYVLSCEGLTLSVADGYEGDALRPVNTLSGGEQFLVSLALALGLAGMGETGLNVDMLFIDEGFGTLSGEHLRSAIEALERLNALTGSHKVGVISHVERLRERIPTHVEVTRTGRNPSEVRVVVNGRPAPV